jgi:hypothetical protein
MSGSAPTVTEPPSEGVFHRIEAFGLRLPFTLATVGMIVLAGWITSTAVGEQLGARTIARLGFAPADTASLDLMRAVVSAFVTNGPAAFWTAVAATSVLAGLVEWRNGSLRAAVAFWGTHFITLALSWALIAPLHLAGDASARLMFLARDVGPSAGYVGCLGYLLFGLRRKARLIALGVCVAILSAALALSVRTVLSQPAEVSAALSHLIALPIGFTLGVITSGKPHPPSRRA